MTDAMKLAIDGGEPIRSTPLSGRFIGTRWVGEEEKAEVLDALERRSLSRVSGMEPPTKVAGFEAELCRWTGAGFAVGVTSGTAALEVALAGLGIGPGDEVIMPALNFISSPESVLRLGGVPVFAEVDASWGIDPADLERRITPRTRAVMPLHVHGAPCRIDTVVEIARRHGLLVLENAAWSLGARYRTKAVGTFGDAGIYSLQSVKVITAGEGGAVVTSDRTVYERAVRYHDHGNLRPDALPTAADGTAAQPELEPFVGAAYRMNELTGAVALAQIRKLDRILDQTQRIQRRLVAEVRGLLAARPDPPFALRDVPDPEGDCGIVVGLIFPTAERAQWASKAMAAEGVPLSWLYGARPVYAQAQLQTLRAPWTNDAPLLRDPLPSYRMGPCPRTEDLMARILTLPITPDHTDQDAADAARALAKLAAAE